MGESGCVTYRISLREVVSRHQKRIVGRKDRVAQAKEHAQGVYVLWEQGKQQPLF